MYAVRHYNCRPLKRLTLMVWELSPSLLARKEHSAQQSVRKISMRRAKEKVPELSYDDGDHIRFPCENPAGVTIGREDQQSLPSLDVHS